MIEGLWLAEMLFTSGERIGEKQEISFLFLPDQSLLADCVAVDAFQGEGFWTSQDDGSILYCIYEKLGILDGRKLAVLHRAVFNEAKTTFIAQGASCLFLSTEKRFDPKTLNFSTTQARLVSKDEESLYSEYEGFEVKNIPG